MSFRLIFARLFLIASCLLNSFWNWFLFRSDFKPNILRAIFWFSRSILSSSSLRWLKCKLLALNSIDCYDWLFPRLGGALIGAFLPAEISTSFFRSFWLSLSISACLTLCLYWWILCLFLKKRSWPSMLDIAAELFCFIGFPRFAMLSSFCRWILWALFFPRTK